jgi:hypothetical protein
MFDLKAAVQLRMQMAAGAVTPPAGHAARRLAGAADAADTDIGPRAELSQ